MANSALRLQRITQTVLGPLVSAPTISRQLGRSHLTSVRCASSGVAGDTGAPTIFDKILRKEIPATVVHDDDRCLAFRDVNPQAPVHVLVIPKSRDGLTQLRNARDDQESILGHLLLTASRIWQKECPDGFRIVINDGKEGQQTVYHLHVHVIGGRQLTWPPG